MKINRVKFMKDFTAKRNEIEKNIGHQSFYMIARSMGIKQKELRDFIIEAQIPANVSFVKMCRWVGKSIDDYKIND